MADTPLDTASRDRDTERSAAAGDLAPVEWHVESGLVDYERAVAAMDARAAAIASGHAAELVWLLEHAALYTAGTQAEAGELVEPQRLPVHRTGRGGRFTYHGPGQRVAYTMLDVRRRFGSDVHALVRGLEAWIIDALAGLGVAAGTRPGQTGVWTECRGAPAKIAAIGIRVRRGVSLHGVSVNVAPDLSHYSGIVPCGERTLGVTSLADLGIGAGFKDVDISLESAFERRFGPITTTDRDP